ncbi:MATE family efflux transporter [Intestinimonas butyriciproducens]|uniref:MATE family efflux transporter n=2 Tax=Intestinimonas butyriciproducens TaxID=1297617 RepID=UPI0009520811|nr:MATE family efflux transporter [Intestinimonas butyriciproducens]MCI6362842.1 MATE family efflux transporter [Intestinimonas butyriciproducens]MCR1907115.1 MATE family efflux transporter [Intestinimonas butyriciproducens]MDB7829241.1 MATE family efflux transporter [Intestinimonas butyriciproducens]MDY3616851.1 MATE family efflux transporter [Intestinimonas butyriciproducens]OLR67192.1 MATE family efflux transporter [Intestinimonas butyriciproducens]
MSERKNDFSKGSIPRNILTLAAPMTLAQLINVLYSVVDRMYLGRLPGHLALTGLGLTMPIVSILMGFANLCGMGGAPLCSICRGQGDDEEAEHILGNSFTLLLILGAAATLVFLLLKRPVLCLFGASEATFPYADAYLTIYLCGTLFVMVSLGMNPFINAQGFAEIGMMTVGLGAVVNIVLDPVFIFVLDMGVQGAALATVIAQGCSAVWVLKFLTGKRAILRLKFDCLALSARRVRKIVSLGLAGFFVNLTNSLVQVVCNTTLQAYGGDLYVGAMTIINSIREVVSMPVQGLSNGSQPVLGYNYGAGESRRVRQGIRFTSIVVVLYSTAAWAIIMLAPEAMIRLFTSEQPILDVGIPALRIYFSLFIIMSLQIAGQSVFTALGRSKNAIFFSLLRKAIINAPLTLLLPYLGMGTDGVFVAEAVSQLIGGLACFLTMYAVVYRPLGSLERAGS